MSIDVVDLRNFYGQRLGVVARRFVSRGIRSLWKDTAGQRVLGIGYATPYLGLFREEAERCLAFMPAGQGVVKWPSTRPALSALVDENELPLTDGAVDRVLLVHGLEMTYDPAVLLREVWRVLASGGRLLAVVPNRRGLWARMDTTPFGHGRPYSRSQINQLLRETWFTPTGWSEALYVPPIARGWFLRSAVAWERTGATLSAPFAGVHLVEATKQVYRAIPARREKRRLVPALKPALAPSPGGAARTMTNESLNRPADVAARRRLRVARMAAPRLAEWYCQNCPDGSRRRCDGVYAYGRNDPDCGRPGLGHSGRRLGWRSGRHSVAAGRCR